MINYIKKMFFNIKYYINRCLNKAEQWVMPNTTITSFLNTLKKFKRIVSVMAALAIALSTGLMFSGQVFTADNSSEGSKKAQIRSAGTKDNEEYENNSIYRAKNYSDRPDSGDNPSRAGLSRDDRNLLARVIEGEAADEPMKGKVAVGAVVMNRVESEKFPDSISQVVYQPLAFEAVSNGQYNRPLTRESLEAADMALEGKDPTGGALYYWNPAKAKSKWVWQRPVIMQIGRHVFAR
ncbi:MAG: cell wall hydrolase [Bacillota bacterium]